MNKQFIISALPRSGTAWVATLLNLLPDVHCWHEAIQHGDMYPNYRSVFEKSQHDCQGDCTTANFEQFDHIDAPRLWIERDETECLHSYRKELGADADSVWASCLKHKMRWVMKHNPWVFSFKKLFSPNLETSFEECRRLVLRATGEDLLPAVRDKWLMLRLLNIEIHGLSPSYYEGRKIIVA